VMKPEAASNIVKISPDVPGSEQNALNSGSAQSKQKLLAELDALGEDKVRVRLASSFYDDENRRALVLEWLLSKVESEAPEVRAAAAAERRARAEERQARAAVRGRNRATIALILAGFSAIGFVLFVLALTE
jgi:hypothetical protein